MKCAIMQPTYFPWMGYFDLLDQVDKFVFLDDVQLVKRSWMVRNRIRINDDIKWLTIPIEKGKGRDETKINEAKINNSENWQKKQINTLVHSYKRAHYFESAFDFIESLILKDIDVLSDFNINLIEGISEKIGITTSTIKSSELGKTDKNKDARLLEICEILGCNEYISPQGSADYIETEKPGGAFNESSVKLYYTNYEHPEYPQIHGDFEPYLCIIDLIFNVGFEKALERIKSGRRDQLDVATFRKLKGFSN